MNEQLDQQTAYLVMFEFLRQYYERAGKPDEIGSLLGGLSVLQDGKSADPAAMQDWNNAVQAVLNAQSSAEGYREADFKLHE